MAAARPLCQPLDHNYNLAACSAAPTARWRRRSHAAPAVHPSSNSSAAKSHQYPPLSFSFSLPLSLPLLEKARDSAPTWRWNCALVQWGGGGAQVFTADRLFISCLDMTHCLCIGRRSSQLLAAPVTLCHLPLLASERAANHWATEWCHSASSSNIPGWSEDAGGGAQERRGGGEEVQGAGWPCCPGYL